MAYVFEVVEDGVVPEWLQQAYQDGSEIQVLTTIGWITLDCGVDFVNGVTYRVKP